MLAKPIQPDFDWYSSISSRNSIQPRCPFSDVEMCPRYYESLSLLGSVGVIRPLQEFEDERLLSKWKKTKHWLIPNKHTVSVFDGKHFMYFCPEVIYDSFGLFASELYRYADDDDYHCAHAQLGENGIPIDDWRWQWSHVSPLHYSECRLYSKLLQSESQSIQEHGKKEIVEVKPNMFGITIDVKEILSRLWKYICHNRNA